MIQVEVVDSVDSQWWNALVGSVPDGTFFQTTYFAEYHKRYLREDTRFLIARDLDGQICGLLLFFKQGLGQQLFLTTPFFPIIASCLKKCFGRYYWEYGPLVLKTRYQSEIVDAIFSKV